MNYQKIYDDLVLRAKSENRKKVKGGTYYENHHILPRCLNGSDSKENLVLLTGREHFVAHKLLAEIYPNEKGLYNSLWIMSTTNSNIKISSREYNFYREIHSKNMIENNPMNKNSVFGFWLEKYGEEITNIKITEFKHKQSENNSGSNNSMYGKKGEDSTCFGRVGEKHPFFLKHHKPESKLKIGLSQKGKPKSPEHNKKNSEANTGKVLSQETKDKIGLSSKGRYPSQETKDKIGLSIKGIPKTTCPWCNSIGPDNNVFKRYHFDNCKNHPDSSKNLIKCNFCDYISPSQTVIDRFHNENCKHNPNYIDKREELECPHCGYKNKSKANMIKYHFNNCKSKPINFV